MRRWPPSTIVTFRVIGAAAPHLGEPARAEPAVAARHYSTTEGDPGPPAEIGDGLARLREAWH